jgi:ABC-type branched-subunit amino acid transport system substrate-binding protein
MGNIRNRSDLTRRVRAMAMVVAVATLGSMILVGTSPAGASGSAPITIGLVTSLTGAAASNFIGAEPSVQAVFDAQNAKGGIDGHKLKLVVADDTSSVQGAQTAVSSLVGRNVFSMIFVSDLTSSGYRPAQEAGVPVVGAPVDGPEWYEQPNTNMFGDDGNSSAEPPVSTVYTKLAKLEGAKNMAVLAIADEEPAIVAAQDFIKGADASGLKVGYYNDTIPIGTVNVESIVLAMKKAGVDGFYSTMLDNTNFAIMEAAKQAGLKLVAPIQLVGYGQTLLTTPSALASAQGSIIVVEQTPVEEHTEATEAEQAIFKKYAHFSGVPGENWTWGYLAAKLTILGLEKTHGNATRKKFMSALRSIKGWTATGLLASPANFTLADFGKAPAQTCAYWVKVEGSAFVPLNNGKPLCGKNLK